MSETKQRNPDEDEACRVTCPDCHLTIVHERPRPAEPVIEVAPGEPTCEYCGPVCYGGAAHNARVEDGTRYTDDPVPGEPTRVALNRCPGCDEYGASHTTPSIEHPAVPTHTCSDCYAPIWSTGNGWRDRLSFRCHVREDGGHRPAVPAQEAPRDVKCGNCGWLIWRKEWARNNWYCPTCHPATEPQTGAQVPSQDELKDYWRCFHCDFHTASREEAEAHFGDRDDAEEFKPLCKWWSRMDEGERRYTLQDTIRVWRAEQDENSKLSESLRHIVAYATEAAKTPITREDMHDPLKAQTFYDEAKGFERLVLSEIGGGK